MLSEGQRLGESLVGAEDPLIGPLKIPTHVSDLLAEEGNRGLYYCEILISLEYLKMTHPTYLYSAVMGKGPVIKSPNCLSNLLREYKHKELIVHPVSEEIAFPGETKLVRPNPCSFWSQHSTVVKAALGVAALATVGAFIM